MSTSGPGDYGGGSAPQGPSAFNSAFSFDRLRPHDGRPTELWELMAGSGRLSAAARTQGKTRLPPIDHRWGWHAGRFQDQLRLIVLLVWVGCRTLFASPSCHPWGFNSRATTAEKREAT